MADSYEFQLRRSPPSLVSLSFARCHRQQAAAYRVEYRCYEVLRSSSPLVVMFVVPFLLRGFINEINRLTLIICVVLCQGEGGHNSNSGSLASQGSQDNGSLRSGRDSSDRPGYLETSLDLNASGDRISFARAAVSPKSYYHHTF